MKRSYLTAAFALLLLFGLVGCHSGSTAARDMRQDAAAEGKTLSNHVRTEEARVHPASFREKNYSLASTTKSALESNGMHDATAKDRQSSRIVRMGIRSAAVAGAAAGTSWRLNHNLERQIDDARDIGADMQRDVKRGALDIAQGVEGLAEDARQSAEHAAAEARDAAKGTVDKIA